MIELVPFYETINLTQPISDAEIEDMLGCMKPAIHITGDLFQEIELCGVNRVNRSFIWEPRLIGSQFYRAEHSSIPSFHSYGCSALFKPSISECLSAIRLFCSDWRRIQFFGISKTHEIQCVGMFHVANLVLISRTHRKDDAQ